MSQRPGQYQRRPPLLWTEICITRTHGQTVRLTHNGTDNNFHAKIQIQHHAPDNRHLRRIFLSKESEIGLRSIAAPVRIYSGNVVAAISIAGPVHRMARKTLLGWVRELVDAADAVSQRLGWQPSRAEALSKRA